LFRDDVPAPAPEYDSRQGGRGPRNDVADDDRYDDRPHERDWRDDYEDAVNSTRWDLSPIPSMPAAPPRRADPRNLEALIPPRRGRIQGPATRHPGGPAGTAPTTREAPWDTGVRERPAPPREEPSSIAKSSRLMAMGTMASRATGLIRQFMIVATLGTGALGGAYAAGNNLPNSIYILIIGGALNAVFVPQLVRSMNRDRDGGTAFASRLVTLTITALTVLTVLAVLAAPQLVELFTDYTGSNRTVAIFFARVCLPQIFFYGVFVILSQILNARGRFGPGMWTPVLANVISIATFGAYWWIVRDPFTTANITPEAMRLVGIGSTLGIVVQTLALIPFVRQSGIKLSLRFDWRGNGLGKSMTLAKWTLLFVLVNQIGLAVVMRYASAIDNVHEGWGLAPYNSAYMIWSLPQALITVSVITALLPRMSRAAAENDLAGVRDDLSYGLRVTAVAIVPASFAFLALGKQIAVVLFMHGSVTQGDAHIIGYMLMAFGLGLIPFSAQTLMLRGFYAFEDTKSPFSINIWIAAVNVVLSSAVYFGLKGTQYDQWSIVAMCAVYGIAYCVGVAIMAGKLKRRLRGIDGRRIQQTYVRLIAASIPAAAAAFITALLITRTLGPDLVGSFAALVVGGGVLGVLFLVFSRLMKVEEVDALVGSVRAKLGR
jgi:putative peptidoglycan lipid II flippase